MKLEDLIKPIPPNKRIKHIKLTNHFIQLDEQYVQILNDVNSENVSYHKSKLNSLIQSFSKIIANESKDIEAIYRFGIINIINNGAEGLILFLELIVVLYRDFWNEIEPKSDIEDSEYLKLITIANIANKITRWTNEFIFFDKNKEYNIIYFLTCIKSNDIKIELENISRSDSETFKKTIFLLKKAYDLTKEIDEVVDYLCSNSSFEDVNELHIQFSDFNKSLESLFNYSDPVYNSILNYSEPDLKNKSENNETDEYIFDDKSTEIITHHAKLLIRNNSNKLLGLCILFCVNKLNVDSMRLMSNIKNDQMLSDFIQYIVSINTDDDE